VASATAIHPEFLSLLQLVSEMPRVGIILVSCGLRRVWEIVLERAKLHKLVAIIAGGRISDELVVTADIKASVVSRLQTHHQKQVWAFGDSPLDLKMLKLADQAFVVVTDEHTRSNSMEAALTSAVNEGLQAQQIILPNNALPRLDVARLPIIDITKINFVNKLLSLENQWRPLPIFIATDAASKLLATPMRDASNSGPKLREAHKQAGRYLVYERLAPIIGLEPEPISHVLGYPAAGSKLFNEDATTIVALMRGGDPMASGVSEALPQAMYVHAKDPGDLKLHHLRDQSQVILVDSVVNTGKSIIEFVRSIRQIHPTIRIFIVVGVIQAQCLCKTSRMYKLLSGYEHVSIVTLRVSDTKFAGSGTTDTGNRLFNTTHLP
jgi:uracil phosphoribosyltransferase